MRVESQSNAWKYKVPTTPFAGTYIVRVVNVCKKIDRQIVHATSEYYSSKIEVKCLYSWYNLPKCTYSVQICKSDPVSFWKRGLIIKSGSSNKTKDLDHITYIPVSQSNGKTKRKSIPQTGLNFEEKLLNSSISGNLRGQSSQSSVTLKSCSQ